MKKIIISAVFFLMAISVVFAQTPNKKQIEKADNITKYLVEKMAFDDTKAAFFKEALLAKLAGAAAETKGKTPEEKKVINKKHQTAFETKLTEKFTKAEIKQINQHVKAFNQL
jgi:hypothetical protein